MGKERGKKHNGKVYTDAEWRNLYHIKAITVPVLKPLGMGWPELREQLSAAWSQSTACANWMMAQFYSRDNLRLPDQEKLGKMPQIYLYPEARKRFPKLPSRTVASLENTLKAKYRKLRYKIIWTGEMSLPNARYPQPFVTSNQAWKPLFVPAGREGGDLVPCVSVALLGSERIKLQLKGGRQWRRQLSDFRRLVEGDAVLSDFSILRRRVHTGDGMTARDSGGQKASYRAMAKMVGWFPKKNRPSSGILYLRTDPDAFLIALDEKAHKIRTWNCDHLRRWTAEHARRLHRWSDDQKAEQRPVARYQSRRESAVKKFRDRITSSQKEIAHQVAQVCVRMNFASVKYDDSCREYIPRYDWSGLQTSLSNKLNEYGIDLVRAVQ